MGNCVIESEEETRRKIQEFHLRKKIAERKKQQLIYMNGIKTGKNVHIIYHPPPPPPPPPPIQKCRPRTVTQEKMDIKGTGSEVEEDNLSAHSSILDL